MRIPGGHIPQRPTLPKGGSGTAPPASRDTEICTSNNQTITAADILDTFNKLEHLKYKHLFDSLAGIEVIVVDERSVLHGTVDPDSYCILMGKRMADKLKAWIAKQEAQKPS